VGHDNYALVNGKRLRGLVASAHDHVFLTDTPRSPVVIRTLAFCGHCRTNSNSPRQTDKRRDPNSCSH
jgi:hypothetical protein